MGNGNKLKLLTIPLDGKTPSETALAHGIAINRVVVWLPKSQIEDWEIKDGSASFYAPEWLITNKGLDMFIDTSHEPSLFE